MDEVDWQGLREKIAGCTKCEIRKGCKQPVFGDGNVAAPIMLVGEAPGENEDKMGLPFVGQAGAVLKKCMVEAGLGPDDVYVTNIVRCRPPENRAPTAAEISNCVGHLLKQIQYVKPKLVVALGGTAGTTLTQLKKNVGKLRGVFFSKLGCTILVTWHPSFVLRSKDALVRAQLVVDLKQAKAYVDRKKKEVPSAVGPEGDGAEGGADGLGGDEDGPVGGGGPAGGPGPE